MEAAKFDERGEIDLGRVTGGGRKTRTEKFRELWRIRECEADFDGS